MLNSWQAYRRKHVFEFKDSGDRVWVWKISNIIYKHTNNFSHIVYNLMNVEKMLGISGQLYKMYVVLLNIYWCFLASVLLNSGYHSVPLKVNSFPNLALQSLDSLFVALFQEENYFCFSWIENSDHYIYSPDGCKLAARGFLSLLSNSSRKDSDQAKKICV